MHNVAAPAFATEVLAASRQTPVVVMFHASWCGPCKSMKPLVEQLAAEQGFTLIGIDAGVERELAAAHVVRGVPTLMVFKDGEEQHRVSGGKNLDQLRSWLAASGIPPKVDL